ncbi:MAG: OpgC domain-containing protein, partial [Deltaproteobacteria bacterium]|nr:OpgC domain-containing protein [Deltaproteobacteria bacterium]
EQLDFLRGTLLLIMTTDHLLLSALMSEEVAFTYTLGFPGFVSAADGFLIVSGMVTGLVFGRMALRKQDGTMWRRSFRRVAEIHLTNFVGLAAICVAAMIYHERFATMAANPYMGSVAKDPGQHLALGGGLLAMPTFFDILVVYCVLLAVTPAVLIRLRAGKTPWILATSVALWLLAQLAPMEHFDQLLIGSLPGFFPEGIHWAFSWFDLLGWQLPFVVGLVIGYHHLRGRLPRLITELSPGLFLVSVSICAACFSLRHGLLPQGLCESLTLWADGRTL